MKNNILYISLIILVGLFIVFKPLSKKKFYGFEYEDSFVSAHVSTQKDLSNFIVSYRTMGCENLEGGKCTSVSSYTGHYATYSIYLFGVHKLFNIQKNYVVHKVGNALLFIICFFTVFFLYRDNFSLLLLYLGLISCLPFLYVLNSGLIENISFSVGLVLILVLYKLKLSNKNAWLILYLILLIVVINIKRENLIYLASLMILNPRKLIKNYIFWIGISCIIISQIAINPFYTEGLEANYLGRETFSLNYFKFQFPTYLASFFRIDGFLAIIVIIFLLTKPSKDSFLFLGLWFALMLSYGFHYRGQYAIVAREITHFETFRYMFNTLPLMTAYFVFGQRRKFFKKAYMLGITLLTCSYLLYHNMPIIEDFAIDEMSNYHEVNNKLNLLSTKEKNIVIHDNFVLISMLNTESNYIDIMSASATKLNFIEGKNNILINRFGILNIVDFDDKFIFRKIDSLSNESSPVFSFEKVAYKNSVK
ncbi:hypothetical protein [Flavobacterium sp. 14A]|uniref:hypothetical protein n=1 Tax=Flavobacterium sp. 14A TaxID=2735896 RepID=UPI00156EBED7|nr:hypothetical protein [Flavobacterium sp. 14A]NRT13136.1 hypothetical protein [Flavobacterium sp. 14A]